MITIKSLKNGFRRCGISHSDVQTSYADDHFTPKQLSVLKAEPMLLVEVVVDEPQMPDDKKPADKKPAETKP